MSHRYQGDEERGDEEVKVGPTPPRSRQPNGTSPGDAPPVRRSWRPCQMLNQDGEPNPHHHHHHSYHPHSAHGPPRHRRRPPAGPGQSQGQGQGQEQTAASSECRDPEPRPVQHSRPGVARYRRHGDPNPRVRAPRPRQPISAIHDSQPPPTERDDTEDTQQRHGSSDAAVTDRGSPDQTAVAVVTLTQLTTPDLHRHLQPEEDEEDEVETKEEVEEEEKQEEKEQQEEGDVMKHDVMQREEEHGERMEEYDEEEEEEGRDAVEECAAQEAEVGDLCSDTESAASLSMDGPLHSPPPLHSPTPPSSPEASTFPQMDHFSEDASVSPPPEEEEEEEEEEDCSESCSLSHSTSCSDSYPKTYADFYSESHKKSFPEPPCDSKPHPSSFPEPLKMSYPELHREPRRRRTEPDEADQESYPGLREESGPDAAPVSSTRGSRHASRPGRVNGSHQTPLDRSVGCRLHHYDGQSDEDERRSPATKSRRPPPRHANGESQAGRSTPREAPDEQEAGRSSGDAISLAIKDIKEAIVEVKTKAVRSPYTPDQLEEPIWVMRREASPTEDAGPQQGAGETLSSPRSPSPPPCSSPSRCSSLPVREPVSPARPESSRAHPHQNNQQQAGHQAQPRDAARSPQAYPLPPPPQPYSHVSPGQHQPQVQHQQLPPQQPRPQVQPQSPQQPSAQEIRRSLPQFPTFVDVPGPCDPEDLIDGIIFAATYLGCTHLLSERTPTKSARMQQAQEAMSRVRSPEADAPSTAEVDLFMSTQRIKVLNADTQESLMDLPLRTISYIADIGNMVVLMARGKMVRSRSSQENLDQAAEQTAVTHDDRRLYRMICHVFESEDAQLIAQSIGQSFSVAYQEFLRANGIDPEDLSQREYSDLLSTQDMYNEDLIHFSKSENCRDVYIEKQKGEIVGVVIVESGWGSILPTVIIASLMHAGPAERSGRLNIGDQIMTINGTSLVGLPLSTCQSIIKGLKSQSRLKMNIVRCPPVTMVLIRRPDLRYQLGFSVQNGIICSLMRGGIAERGGVRVGHRIIEINSQSVVATAHEKIVQILSTAMGEIHMKTMPAAMYRLLTAQEQPVYI
ncbi:uncharacterized protein LOC143008296 isoform X2 [Genypterus blacodes]|uniref:uncharacterized protein LOC143008296 isoform X2 n=1 Tax=Genypterus blacodes TaxID=154954 RepID=UPI003F75DF13